jgi:hypothetical protein
MPRNAYHLAQINIGRILAPLDSPIMAGFVNNLDRINALAESSPGFVWRLVGEGNNATDLRPFEDDTILVNMSVWETFEDLKAYVYKSDHTEFIRWRKEWFTQFEKMHMCLWWVREGHIPTPREAKERLDHYWAHGESAYAFTFRSPYPAPGEEG